MKNQKFLVNVIFDAGKGTCAQETKEAAVGDRFGTLPQPTRRGYRFAGWYRNGEEITAETPVDSESDVTLTAKWEKSARNQVKTMHRRQKTACFILAGVILFLAIALAVVQNVVQIYGVTDTFYDADGEVQTEKYYVRKKSDGVYRLYNRKGVLMDQNDDGKYIVTSGNQYTVDEETGDCELYAVVDYDRAGGEVLGFNDRILMFPQIKQADVYSISVENEYGSYRFHREENGTVVLDESKNAGYDQEKYAALVVACGYTLSNGKLDFSEDNPYVVRLSDGSVDYSEFGLTETTDGAGNVVKPARYTVVALDQDALAATGKYTASEEVYTVEIGSQTVSGDAFYFRLVGRDAVYLMADTELTVLYGTGTRKSISDLLLAPVESLVTPAAVYPGTSSTYLMVQDFYLGKIVMEDLFSSSSSEDLLDKFKNESDGFSTVVTFSYENLTSRENTMYSAVPFVSLEELMAGYRINDDHISAMLANLYQMEFLGCRKLGIDAESLERYGFTGEVYWLYYQPALMQTDGSGSNNVYYSDELVNNILISRKTENGTYYIASFLYDMIVEVDSYYLTFLEWDLNEWYEDAVFKEKISYVTDLSYEFQGKSYDFTMDNSASDKSTSSSDQIKIYCEQYHGSLSENEHLLDYSILHQEKSDTGETTTETVDAVSNFRSLYQYFISLTIEGDLDRAEFEANMGMNVEDYLREHGDDTDAKLTYHAKDFASTHATVKTEKDNEKDIVMRFYRYSNQKYLITVESLQRNADGTLSDSNPTNVKAVFYVNGEALSKLAKEAENLISQQYIDF